MPVNVHILTGFNYSRFDRKGLDTYKMTVNQKLTDAANTLFDLVFGGAVANHPKLKIVYVENEVGWIPFYCHEWDKYFIRHQPKAPLPYMKKLPGEYVRDQVFATFFSDPCGGRMMDWFGEDNFMWSSDYPHNESTYGYSGESLASVIDAVGPEAAAAIVGGNIKRFLGLES
jgi:predicted TIM-barrel fold metal-dependent hydrolase